LSKKNEGINEKYSKDVNLLSRDSKHLTFGPIRICFMLHVTRDVMTAGARARGRVKMRAPG